MNLCRTTSNISCAGAYTGCHIEGPNIDGIAIHFCPIIIICVIMHMALGWPRRPRVKARSSPVAFVGPFGTLSSHKCLFEDRTVTNQRRSRANSKEHADYRANCSIGAASEGGAGKLVQCAHKGMHESFAAAWLLGVNIHTMH